MHQTTALGIPTYHKQVMGKGTAQTGKMDAILTDSHLDARIWRFSSFGKVMIDQYGRSCCTLSDGKRNNHLEMYPDECDSSKARYIFRRGGVWEGDAKSVKQLEAVQMTAAETILRCSSTTSSTALDKGMHPLETNRDARKLK